MSVFDKWSETPMSIGRLLSLVSIRGHSRLQITGVDFCADWAPRFSLASPEIPAYRQRVPSMNRRSQAGWGPRPPQEVSPQGPVLCLAAGSRADTLASPPGERKATP
jgi:hypothetical protein